MSVDKSDSEIGEIEAAIYQQSFRTLDEQAKVLDGLRTRAGALVAVANVATAFVGGLALANEPHSGITTRGAGGSALTALEWSAVGLFFAVIVLSLLVLMPWRNWVFTHHPHGLLGAYLDPGPAVSLSEYRRTIAYYNGAHYDANGARLRWLFTAFTLASVCLVTELVIWLWILGT